MSKNCLIFLCALTFCACVFAEDHYWCEGQIVEIEKCPTNEAIKNITVELAKGTDGKIVPTSMLFGVKVKTGAYELDLNVDKWLAWSRGEAKKESPSRETSLRWRVMWWLSSARAMLPNADAN